jgi:hypothetical protein
MPCRSRMKTRRRCAITLLFPHRDDPAYQKLAELEELVAPCMARRTTAAFKQRMQRAIAKLSDGLVEYAHEEDDTVREPLLIRALFDCRRILNTVEFLHRAGVLTRLCCSEAFELLADIAQLLIDRIHELRGIAAPGALARPALNEEICGATPSAPSNAAGPNMDGEGGESPPRMLDG